MHKIFYLSAFFVFCFSNQNFAQLKPTTQLPQKDSLNLMTQLKALLDSTDEPTSYLVANVSVGNRLFSEKNNALNANQSSTNLLVYSPSLGYAHKSGLGLTVGANLLNDINGFGVNQYSISPSFDLADNKNIAFGISYTRYFVNNKFSPYSSPIQNDFYTALTFKKTWVQPGIALGYSTGQYSEVKYKDTVVTNTKKHYYDSVNYSLTAFSLNISAGHQFLWYGILDKQDGLGLTTTLIANAGSGKTTITHNTNAAILFARLTKKGRIPKLQNDKFEMQSIGCNLDLNYTIGHLSLQPQFYIDCYLPATDANRVSHVFVFNIGYTF